MSLPGFAGGGAGMGGIDTGDIANSLRFRRSASAYLSRTWTTATDRKKGVLFFCLKKTQNGVAQAIIGSYAGDSNNYTAIYFDSSDRLVFANALSAANSVDVTTSSVFRDPTSHLVGYVLFDSTLTAADRAQIWIRGPGGAWTRQPVTGGGVAANAELHMQGAVTVYIGQYGASNNFLDGNLSRTCWVDGSTPDKAGFAYTNTDINELVVKTQSEVKAVVDAGGANSFMLDFDDATSLTTLGYDKSSKGNNWTSSGHSLTAGVTYDHMLDVPGNSFATLNPLVPIPAGSLANGNLSYSRGSTAGFGSVAASMTIPTTGEWCWEVTACASANNEALGVANIQNNPQLPSSGNEIGSRAGDYAYRTNALKVSGGSSSAYGATYTATDVIGFVWNSDAGTLTAYKGGVSQGTMFSSITQVAGKFAPAGSSAETGFDHFNFGQRPMAHSYGTALPLCQANLPTPAILNPRDHFDAYTYTGANATTAGATDDGSAKSGVVLFPPDLAWLKNRSSAAGYNNVLRDSIRGAYELYSNSTSAETAANGATNTFGYIKSLDATGFTLGRGNSGSTPWREVDESGVTYATWLWKAGGAAVTNNAGSISSQVSANVEAGFSIVTYTGTGANATVGHGLGVAPKMVIVKSRTQGGAWGWAVYHKSLTSAAYYLQLAATTAQANLPSIWNSTDPTSTVFSIGTDTFVNGSTYTYVAYCFAEIPGYSKIGSYPGNGSADGPYVECGFKPRFVMIKRSDAAASWYLHDTARDTYNQTTKSLYPNLPAEEDTGFLNLDITASGFKVRTTTSNNASGGTYIFIAIAETAGKYANAR